MRFLWDFGLQPLQHQRVTSTVAPIDCFGQVGHASFSQAVSEISHDAPHGRVGSSFSPDLIEEVFYRDVAIRATRESLEELEREREAQVACSPVPVDGKGSPICDQTARDMIKYRGGVMTTLEGSDRAGGIGGLYKGKDVIGTCRDDRLCDVPSIHDLEKAFFSSLFMGLSRLPRAGAKRSRCTRTRTTERLAGRAY